MNLFASFAFHALLVLCLFSGIAQAESYPSKSIRIIVPYTPGGFNDTLARTLAQNLHEKWGQPVVVDNRPGGGTTITVLGAVRDPHLHDPRPIEEVEEDFRRQGLTVTREERTDARH